MVPGIRPVPFGHVGDGNIHFNLSQPEGAERAAYLARWAEVSRAVPELVVEMDGSISAEHGIGYLKVAENARFKTAAELALLRSVTPAFDPAATMTPGPVCDSKLLQFLAPLSPHGLGAPPLPLLPLA